MAGSKQFVRTVAELAQIAKDIKTLEDRKAELYESLGSLEVRNYPAGDYILRVTKNRRFDPVTAIHALDAATAKRISTLVPQSGLAKKYLTDAQYAQCQKELGLTRTIVPVTDWEGDI